MKLVKFAAVALIALAPLSVMARGGGGGHGGGHGGSHSGSHHASSGNPGYHLVHTYVRSDGAVVEQHYQTNPNGTRNDNWSTRGNVNPFTGKPGDKPGDNGQ